MTHHKIMKRIIVGLLGLIIVSSQAVTVNEDIDISVDFSSITIVPQKTQNVSLSETLNFSVR